ncbi:Hypothetical protein LUCI_1334 [Lucifera butyrica]|uniref:Uncharacterized protein n=1 Tax=Lucifera butyrica TaxID=1351585 RepID=A0A498R4P7_9FIRM|nr:hypothetical protein [Lucifera butyrica]VBB06119.1 Hypothetical protein LUCI_1334 [Lucifera butyrica]
MLKIEKTFRFTVIGFIFMAIAQVDFINGSFILRGPSSEMRFIFLTIGITVLCTLATLYFTFKERLKLFFNLSIGFVIFHTVWFMMGLVVERQNSIPMKGSMPLFHEAFTSYINGDFIIMLIMNVMSLILAFLYFITVMIVILMIKKCYKQIMTYWLARKD